MPLEEVDCGVVLQRLTAGIDNELQSVVGKVSEEVKRLEARIDNFKSQTDVAVVQLPTGAKNEPATEKRMYADVVKSSSSSESSMKASSGANVNQSKEVSKAVREEWILVEKLKHQKIKSFSHGV